jgi:hypothetical protein
MASEIRQTDSFENGLRRTRPHPNGNNGVSEDEGGSRAREWPRVALLSDPRSDDIRQQPIGFRLAS